MERTSSDTNALLIDFQIVPPIGASAIKGHMFFLLQTKPEEMLTIVTRLPLITKKNKNMQIESKGSCQEGSRRESQEESRREGQEERRRRSSRAC